VKTACSTPFHDNSIPEQMIFIPNLIQTKMKEDLSDHHMLINERNNLHSPPPVGMYFQQLIIKNPLRPVGHGPSILQ
jgi:hypothetical protein